MKFHPLGCHLGSQTWGSGGAGGDDFSTGDQNPDENCHNMLGPVGNHVMAAFGVSEMR